MIKGPGKLNLLRLPPGHLELARFVEFATLARDAALNLRIYHSDLWRKTARHYGAMARSYYADYLRESGVAA